jgi:coproporphyrinogen III oxidase-like Fe-S oxidoreductase
MERVELTGTGDASVERVSSQEHLRERIFTGLRLAEGVDLAALERDLDLPVRDKYASVIARTVADGLGSFDGAVLRLNDRGFDLHSEVSLRFF